MRPTWLILMAAIGVVAIGLVLASRDRTAIGPIDGHDLTPFDTGRVAVGDLAPDFRLPAYERGLITLSELRGQRDVILVFYRGHW